MFFAWLAKISFSFRSLNLLQQKSSTILFSCLKLRKILGKFKGHVPGEINLQCKQDPICHVAKVKVEASTHSMADVIPFQCRYYSLRIESFHNTERKYTLHTIKKISE